MQHSSFESQPARAITSDTRVVDKIESRARETLSGQSPGMQASRMRNLRMDRTNFATECDFSLCLNGRQKNRFFNRDPNFDFLCV